jgi:glutathione S-transferase
MQPPFRLYGAEHSAFTQKLLTYLRFKGLEHTYVARTAANAAEFARLARLPLIPLLVEADGRTAQDSTMILDRLEQAHPTPSARSGDPALVFLSALLEDFADEWLHKLGLYYRWAEESARVTAAHAVVKELYGAEAPAGAAEVVAARMAAKLPVAGAVTANGAALEACMADALALLDAHLMGRSYMFGAAPCAADFAIAAQLAQMQRDERSSALIGAFPFVLAYLARMAAPVAAEGADFEALDGLQPTLEPLLSRHVGAVYLAFAARNLAAYADGGEVDLTIFGHRFTQSPQRYAGRAFQELRRKRAAVADDAALGALLVATGCEVALAPPQEAERGASEVEDELEPADAGADAAPGAETDPED